MKPPPFEYHRPATLEAALDVLSEHASVARPLAGGQSLVPLLAMRRLRPEHLVDLERIAELHEVSSADGEVRIGAMRRQCDVERDPRMPALVRAVVPHIGHVAIRNRGTVGGSLAHMDPAAEWPALALVLDAVLVAASVRGRRRIAAGAFFLGPNRTALAPDELLVEVVIPGREGAGFGFAEATRRGPGDFALAGAMCHGTAVAVFGVGPTPQRLRTVETLLRDGGGTPEEIAALAGAEIEVGADARSSAAYRRRVGAALVSRAVADSRTGRGDAAWS